MYHLLNLTLHLGPIVSRAVCPGTPCSIKPSLRLTENMGWMIQNNKTRRTERPLLLTGCPCLAPGWLAGWRSGCWRDGVFILLLFYFFHPLNQGLFASLLPSDVSLCLPYSAELMESELLTSPGAAYASASMASQPLATKYCNASAIRDTFIASSQLLVPFCQAAAIHANVFK